MASGGEECQTKPMDEKHRKLIRSRRVELARDMEPRHLIHYMADVLTPVDEEEIKALPTRWSQSEKLLDIVPRRGQKAFDSFVKALKEVQPFLGNILVDDVPGEIIVRGHSARQEFYKALLEGKVQLKRVPIMIIGQGGSGKTSLKKSLKGEPFNPEETSTIMMEIDPSHCKVSTEVWKMVGRNQAADSADSGGRMDEDEEGLIEMLQRVLGKDEDEEEIYATLWDFGGQLVYYATSSLFITENAVYFLVYNLSRNPGDKAIPLLRQGLFKVVQDTFSDKTNMAYLDFWMSMISCFASQDEEGQNSPVSQKLPETLPPVFFVCSHADKPYNGANPRELAREIYGNLMEKKSGSHLFEDFFVVDNTKAGTADECPDVTRLKTSVLTVAKELPHLKQDFPKKWFRFEKALEVMCERGATWIPVHKAKEIALKVCSIRDDEEFMTLMNLLHDKRILIHFTDSPELNKMVILNIQWLIDVFKKVITVEPYESKERKFKDLWWKLQDTGILEEKLLQHMWAPMCMQEEIFDSLIAIMERFSLLCRWTSSDARGASEYLVPSMLTSSPPEDVKKLIASSKIPSLFLRFESGQVPPNLFPRLVVQFFQWCTEMWPGQPHPQLFLNFARFLTHPADGYSVILLCHSSSIEVAVHSGKQSSDLPNEGFNVNITRDMGSHLRMMLEVMSKELLWLKNMQFEVSVLCPVCCEVCKSGHEEGCRQEKCLHFLSESELLNSEEAITCTKSAFAGDVVVRVKRFSHWFKFLDDEHATVNQVGGRWTPDQASKKIALPGEVIQSLLSQSCDAKEVVLQLKEILQLDQASLEEPEPETKTMIRCLARKTKNANRLDVFEHLREMTPAGTTGPLLPEHLDVRNIPVSRRRELTIDLSGGEGWKVVAEGLGLTPQEIRFLDNRTLNPLDAALAFIAKQRLVTVGELYDLLSKSGYPVLADLL